jgi:hypothetical protein
MAPIAATAGHLDSKHPLIAAIRLVMYLGGLKVSTLPSAEFRWPRPLSHVRGLTGGFLAGFTGNGCQPAMVRAQARAWSLSRMPGNSRRISTAADSSPP